MKKWTRRAFIGTGVLAGGAAIFGIAIRPGNRASKVAGKLSTNGENLLNLWVKIAPNNSITAYIPHAEMGQGAHTSLAMMLAEELDADWSTLKIEEAPAHKEYVTGGVIRGFGFGDAQYSKLMQDTMNGLFNTVANVMDMQLTGGSASVRFTGKFVMRIAGAAAREMLIKAAAKSWDVPSGEITTENSYLIHEKSSKKEPYATFAAAATEEKMSVQPRLKEPSAFKIIGTDIQRNDIPAKVNGTAVYGLDISLPNMKYATVKAPPVFGAKLKSFDASALNEISGYTEVIQFNDTLALISDSYWLCKSNISKIKTEYANTENDGATTESIFKTQNDNLADPNKWKKAESKGDLEETLAQAKNIVEREYKVPYLAHAAMEPLNCTIHYKKDSCEVWLGCQNPRGIQAAVAKILNLDIDKVIVHNQYLGGGFGRKSETDIAEQAAQIASQVDYPIKLIWSREEDIQQDKYREGSISKFKAVVVENKIEAWHNVYTYQNHPNEASIPPYRIENLYVGYASPKTHIPWGNWRSVSHSKHGFFIESFVDELAVELQADPLEFRIALLQDKPRLKNTLELAAKKANYKAHRSPNGTGVGVSIVESFGTIVAQIAEVEISETGELKVQKVTCVADPGLAVHPDAFKAQMESGIIFGLSAALSGEINFENGAVKESNFHDYELLRMYDAPIIETHIINSGETIGGAGEPSTPGIAPAVCNAIYDATGVRIRTLPINKYDLSIENWSKPQTIS